MRVVAKSSLVKFWGQPGYADSQGALQSWYDEAIKANWRTPQDVKDLYSSASICANNRVVFNIKGNDYRLVVFVAYQYQAVYVKFIGTQKEYDAIDAETVEMEV